MGLIDFILDQKRRGDISDIATGVQSGQIQPNEALLRYAMATGDPEAFQAGAKQSALARLYQMQQQPQQNGSVGDTQPDQPIPQTLPDQTAPAQPQTRSALPSVDALAASGMFDPLELTKLARQQQELELEKGRLNLANQQLEMGRIPSGYRKTKDGNLEPIPGGPAASLSEPVSSSAPQAQTTETGASLPPAPPNLTGDEFLKTLPTDKANMVKALADGRMQFPRSIASSKNPYWKNILDAVAQYDPDFDAANYNARSQTRKAFTSGTEAKSVNALNTVAGHLGKLKEAYDSLNNTDIPAFNWAQNGIGKQLGSNRKTTFDTIVGPVAEEMVRAYRGIGGAESDIKRNLETLNSSSSPEQAKKSFEALGGLLKSKIDALQDQYRRGMGTAAQDRQFYTPEAVKAFKSIGLDLGKQPAQTTASPLSSMSLEDLKALRSRLAGGKR